MDGERLIDRQRIQAQAELLERITSGGQTDVEKAMRERKTLADRVENRRGAYLTHMKKMGWPREMIVEELAELDRLLVALRVEPFSQEAFQMPDLGF